MDAFLVTRADAASHVTTLAARLRDARETKTPCAALTDDFPDLTEDDAYAIQQENLRHSKPIVVGRKIGITSEAVMRWLNVDHPDFGALTADMAVPNGGQVDFTRLLQPRVEGEIAFILKRDLSGPGVTAATVLAATDFLLPAIEIIDSRIRDWKLKLADTIADNASCGMFVLGSQPVAPSAVDLAMCGMTLRHNGEVSSTGCGAACMGSPVNAVAWLANRLGAAGIALKAGQIILSGALGPVVPAREGDYTEVQISGLGRVSAHF